LSRKCKPQWKNLRCFPKAKVTYYLHRMWH